MAALTAVACGRVESMELPGWSPVVDSSKALFFAPSIALSTGVSHGCAAFSASFSFSCLTTFSLVRWAISWAVSLEQDQIPEVPSQNQLVVWFDGSLLVPVEGFVVVLEQPKSRVVVTHKSIR